MKPVSHETIRMLLLIAGPYTERDHITDFRYRVTNCEDCWNTGLCRQHHEEVHKDKILYRYAMCQSR